MFRDYIYLDMDRITKYGNKLNIKKVVSSQVIEQMNRDKTIDGVEESSIIKATKKEEIKKEYEDMFTNETYFEEFENKLEKLNEKKDFIDIQSDDEIKNIKKQMIVRFQSNLLVPDEFGQFEFFQKILKNESIKKKLLDTTNDEIPKEFMNTLIRDKGSIPIYFELDNYILYSNIKGKYLCNIEYLEFEENINEELTVVAKVEKMDSADKEIELYDAYKELLGVNREMRRSMISQSDDIQGHIKIKGKGIKLVVIAIYK